MRVTQSPRFRGTPYTPSTEKAAELLHSVASSSSDKLELTHRPKMSSSPETQGSPTDSSAGEHSDADIEHPQLQEYVAPFIRRERHIHANVNALRSAANNYIAGLIPESMLLRPLSKYETRQFERQVTPAQAPLIMYLIRKHTDLKDPELKELINDVLWKKTSVDEERELLTERTIRHLRRKSEAFESSASETSDSDSSVRLPLQQKMGISKIIRENLGKPIRELQDAANKIFENDPRFLHKSEVRKLSRVFSDPILPEGMDEDRVYNIVYASMNPRVRSSPEQTADSINRLFPDASAPLTRAHIRQIQNKLLRDLEEGLDSDTLVRKPLHELQGSEIASVSSSKRAASPTNLEEISSSRELKRRDTSSLSKGTLSKTSTGLSTKMDRLAVEGEDKEAGYSADSEDDAPKKPPSPSKRIGRKASSPSDRNKNLPASD